MHLMVLVTGFLLGQYSVMGMRVTFSQLVKPLIDWMIFFSSNIHSFLKGSSQSNVVRVEIQHFELVII